eukprot:CAMPEP_0204303540 /NCGR_PEP_ID=MMETSP0468-20130131/83960_1 /ASSEMBLY_ACC=CAM_ASM_000383 /TAXON_ID=2969 /ORGANISM="Oxyrrhis marina" /LENGTH=449 /DNA_ID=CAMNT_0051282853 /DNA_START=45 /DNA_END=1394 /DNA_ORIENTATION=+
MKLSVAFPLAAAYNQDTALEYAKLAGAAYCSDSALEAWSCGDKCSADVKSVKICKGDTTKSFVGVWDSTCVVSFEGTSNIQSFITDLEFWKSSTDWDVCDGCKVHSGFLKEYKSMQSCVKQSLADLGCPSGSSIKTTGHSLGAAIDGIAMMDLHSAGWKIAESYNSLEAWSCGDKCSADVKSVKICKGDTTKSFVGVWDGTCVVSFEGTSNVQSFVTDLEFWKSSTSWDVCDGCKVHSGFLKEYKSMQSCVKSTLADLGCPSGSSIKTTGHSLGAAIDGIAMMDLHSAGWNGSSIKTTGHSLGAAIDGIAMMDLHSAGWKIAESYNFGMPRTGNEQFAAAFNKLFSSNFYRVTHHRDPVVQVPPDALIVNWHFTHVEPEVFYKGKVSAGFHQCSDASDKKCSHMYWDIAIDLLNLADHLDYMGVDTSFFDCKKGAEDNDLGPVPMMLVV